MSSFDEKIFNAVSDLTTLTNNPFKGKWVSILGDSISTYDKYIPSGYTTYYPTSDVNDVSKTWWHILLTKLGAKLCVNNSNGARSVFNDSTGTDITKDELNKLHRVKGQEYINLDGTKETATADIKPDIILVLLGTNDFTDGIKLGELIKNSAGTSNFNTNFYQSYNAMLLNLIVNYPNAHVYCLETTYNNKFNFLGKNSANNYQSEFNLAIEETARIYGVHCIHTSKLPITQTNKDTYLLSNVHPKAAMMNMIANQCYREMVADNCL